MFKKKKKSLLIVDENPHMQKMLKSYFSHVAKVESATSVEEAITKSRKQVFDAVISDRSVNGESAKELVKDIQSRPGSTLTEIRLMSKSVKTPVSPENNRVKHYSKPDGINPMVHDIMGVLL